MSLSSDRWPQLEALFYEASALDSAARNAFLDARCSEIPPCALNWNRCSPPRTSLWTFWKNPFRRLPST
jgi:hypothetical protein